MLIEDLVFEARPLEVYVFRYTIQADKKAKKGEEKMEANISILKGSLPLEALKKPGETQIECKLDLEPVLVEEQDKESYSALFKGSLNLEEGMAAEIAFKKPETANVPYLALSLSFTNAVVPHNVAALKIQDIIPKRVVAKQTKTGDECLVDFNKTLQN